MYYSLVVRANESLPMPGDRMFEETSRELVSKLTQGSNPNLALLSKYPIILTREFQDGDTSTEAVIGYMDDPSMNPRVRKPILRFAARALVDRGILSGKWPGSRTRWIVFEGDPYRLLAGVETIREASGRMDVVNERQVCV